MAATEDVSFDAMSPALSAADEYDLIHLFWCSVPDWLPQARLL